MKKHHDDAGMLTLWDFVCDYTIGDKAVDNDAVDGGFRMMIP